MLLGRIEALFSYAREMPDYPLQPLDMVAQQYGIDISVLNANLVHMRTAQYREQLQSYGRQALNADPAQN